MGKSSLMARTAQRLRDADATPVILDLTAIGQNVTPEQWYEGSLSRLGRAVDLEDELEDFWFDHEHRGPMQRWVDAIEQVVFPRTSGRIVVFVDEIDMVRSLPFSTNEFFAGIRECYTRRTEDGAFARLTFCLIGVATPSDLIDDPRVTPFNIGRRIDLTDFTDEEALRLSDGLGRVDDVSSELMQRVLHWTGGHPYLTQRLSQAVAGDASVRGENGVDGLCAELFFSERSQEQDSNLQFVRNQMLSREEVDPASLLTVYRDVRAGKSVPHDETSPAVNALQLSGVAHAVAGSMRVRNRIYEHVFDRAWIQENTPDAELRRQREAYRRGILRASAAALVILAAIGMLAGIALKESRNARRSERVALSNLSDAQMVRGIQSLRRNDPSGLLHLLEAQRSVAAYPELAASRSLVRSGWLKSYNSLRLRHVLSHEAGVLAVAFSPDDAMVATCGYDNTVRVWDVETGRPITPPLHYSGTVRDVAFDRGGDLMSVCTRGGVDLWTTDRWLHYNHIAFTGNVFGGTFSPDSARLALTAQTSIVLWNLVTAEHTSQPASAGGAISSARPVFTLDGNILHTAGGQLQLWDGHSAEPSAVLRDSDSSDIALHPDGQTVAGRTTSNTVGTWDLATGKSAGASRSYTDGIRSVEYSGDGRWLAASAGSRMHLLDADTLTDSGQSVQHQGSVHDIRFSADSRLIAIASNDGSVSIWEMPDDVTSAPDRCSPRRRRTGKVACVCARRSSTSRVSGRPATARL